MVKNKSKINNENLSTDLDEEDKKVEPKNLVDNNEQLKKTSDENNKSVEIIEKLKEEASESKDEKLRILAEMENLRKRLEKEKSDTLKYSTTSLCRELLLPCDNLSRALESINKGDKKNESLINGINMVYQELMTLLEKNGVKKIESMNKKFDHNFHQAMFEVETDNEESGIVVQELQSGYLIHDRLLRPAMVGVSKKIEKNEENK